MKNGQKRHICCAFLALAIVALSSCSSREGWGVLLWATDDPFVPSGTVLPVYIRSNIDRVWVVGLPAGMRTSSGLDKMEVPLAHLELVGNRSRAEARALEFGPYAFTYAENLQTGLPIRAHPDNNARRLYRMREGQVVKILGASGRGVPPLGVTGQPLPGNWYRVLSEDGTIGYTFSYRLRLFDRMDVQPAVQDVAAAGIFAQERASPMAAELETLLSRTWWPESYLAMVNSGRINLDELSRRWHFDPGRGTNVAHINVPGVNQFFSYASIVPTGDRSWTFEGTTLSMHLRSENVLTVQFTESGGAIRPLTFVSLPVPIDNIIAEERERRANLYNAIFSRGPAFTSSNFGTIVFGADGSFNWSGFDLLVPRYIPGTVSGRGTVSMDLFLSPTLADRHSGAFTMSFAGGDGRPAATLRSMYTIDSQGFRIEIVPEASIDGVTVARRAATPMVLFFFADDAAAAPEIVGMEAAGAVGADTL